MDIYVTDTPFLQTGHMLWVLPSLRQSMLPEGLPLPYLFITWLDSVRICAKIKAHHVTNIRT